MHTTCKGAKDSDFFFTSSNCSNCSNSNYWLLGSEVMAKSGLSQCASFGALHRCFWLFKEHNRGPCRAGLRVGLMLVSSAKDIPHSPTPTPTRVTFRRVAVSVRGPEQPPVGPFAGCIGTPLCDIPSGCCPWWWGGLGTPPTTTHSPLATHTPPKLHKAGETPPRNAASASNQTDQPANLLLGPPPARSFKMRS